jgi:1-acyl-sn-glycerol-3-phosphate acyltransferase
VERSLQFSMLAPGSEGNEDRAVLESSARIEEAPHPGDESEIFQRDPEFIASLEPWLGRVQQYFDSEVRGWENLPDGEPVLIVGNHSGGLMTLDPAHLMFKWISERGCSAPLYALAYDLLFAVPCLSSLLRRIGCLPASQDNARRALEKGASVIVFPGGDQEVFRPWLERNKLDFNGRTGFIELAISARVRVVPMTIHGAHESTVVLTRGRSLARLLGLDRFRVKVFPFIWGFPFGFTPAFVPTVPLPSKVTVVLGEPFDWTDLTPEDAEDPSVVAKCYEEITGTMQATLDALAQEYPYPLFTRIAAIRNWF